MYGLTKKEKLNFILEKLSEMEISAYELGKKTGLNISGLERIMNRSVKNPHENTLDSIITFLESKVLGSNIGKVEESKNSYNSNQLLPLTEEYMLECEKEKYRLSHEVINLMKEAAYLKDLLRKNKINFDEN